jgi:hypothetical protein
MLDFPANPASGDLYGSWFWDGEKWMSTNAPAAVRASDTPPPNPKPGDLWFDTVGLALYVRYDDGTSVQWVVTINQPTLPDAKSDGFLYGRADGAWSSGGTLSGALTVEGGWLQVNGEGWTAVNIDRPAGFGAQLVGLTSGVARWSIQVGDATAESGSNAGSDFAVTRYDDSGAVIDNPLTINRSSGILSIGALTGNNYLSAPTITGGGGGVACDGPNASERAFRVSTNGVMRWYWGRNAQSETGGDTGSVYFLASCYDAGGYKATAFTVARTDMTVSFSYPIYNPSTRAGKQNIAPLTEALPKILSLDGVAYDADNGERYLGLIAEDVQKVIPEIVAERSIGPESEAMLCISYQQMVPVLIEAIKTLTARLEALENK